MWGLGAYQWHQRFEISGFDYSVKRRRLQLKYSGAEISQRPSDEENKMGCSLTGSLILDQIHVSDWPMLSTDWRAIYSPCLATLPVRRVFLQSMGISDPLKPSTLEILKDH